MKFRFLTLLAVAFVFGCSKQASNGTVASNAPVNSTATTSTTSGGANGSAASTGGGSVPSGTATATTGSTAGTAVKPTTTGTTAGPGTTPTKGSVPTPGPGGAQIQTTPGVTPPGQQPTLTPEQQKAREEQMKKMQADRQKAMQDNAAKAEKATRSNIEGISGTYIGFIDDSKVTAEMRKRPGFDEQLAKAKEEVKKASLTVAANGDVTVKGVGPDPVVGFSSKVDGKPAFVFTNPKPQPGQPMKQFVPITIKNSGSIIFVGGLGFKKG